MIYIGVDPGAKGGIALVGSDGSAIAYPWDDDKFVSYMRTATIMRDRDGEKLIAAVEKVGAVHGNGIVSSFSFGRSFGYILGCLSAFAIPYQLVPPNVWKREFSLIGKDKAASIEVCKRLYPNINLLPTERCKKESDGMAEAVLIATHAKRHF